jgi:hypothetical protein
MFLEDKGKMKSYASSENSLPTSISKRSHFGTGTVKLLHQKKKVKDRRGRGGLQV